jgi:hypothetical protein
MSVLLLTKLALAPSVVASGSVAGRRWGHQVGGLVAGFPNTSSPILFFLALERGPAFAADAAVGTLLGLVSLAAYGLVYVWAATRVRWWLALPLGWAAFLLTAWPLRKLELPWWQAGLLAVLALAVALKAMPSLLEPGAAPLAEKPRPRAELLFRMAAAVALLLGVTAAAGWLGPNLSGVFSAFPVASSVLTAAAHREAGPAGAKWVLMGIFMALLALILFTALLPLLLAALPLLQAFVAATALGFAGQALVLWQRHRVARVLARF